MILLDAFYTFLNELSSSATAREYSHYASLLDMGAIAGVALQNLLERGSKDEWWQRLAVGALSESLMILAARQYVKAWDNEMTADFNNAAWISVPLLLAVIGRDAARFARRRTAPSGGSIVGTYS
jgi:hypothetical protein